MRVVVVIEGRAPEVFQGIEGTEVKDGILTITRRASKTNFPLTSVIYWREENYR